MTALRRALIVVARQPIPGQTKTRLAPPLNEQQACALYECFLRDTLDIIRAARRLMPFQPVIAFLPVEGETYFKRLAPDFERIPQRGAHLAERLNNALTTCLTALGYDQAVIMDSDSPTVAPEWLCQAFRALDGPAEVSLGPCEDGGYYLIGLKRPAPSLFLTVTMSTPQVLADTLSRARDLSLAVEMLPTGYDIDLAADLQHLIRDLAALPESTAPHTRTFFCQHPDLVSQLEDEGRSCA